MSDLIIFDTSVLVDQMRTDCHRRRIETLNGLIRNSAVVMAELWRGVVNAGGTGGSAGPRQESSYADSNGKELA